MALAVTPTEPRDVYPVFQNVLVLSRKRDFVWGSLEHP